MSEIIGTLQGRLAMPRMTHADFEAQVSAMGIQISDADFHGLRVLWVDGEAWLMGDLHAANIMRDAHGQDRVIDALFMRVPSGMIAENQAVRAAVELARKKSEGADDSSQGMLFA
jgi:hypothetical protein